MTIRHPAISIKYNAHGEQYAAEQQPEKTHARQGCKKRLYGDNRHPPHENIHYGREYRVLVYKENLKHDAKCSQSPYYAENGPP